MLAPEEHSLIGTGDEMTADDRVFVPISTLERVLDFEVVSILWGEAVSLRDIDTAKRQILAILDANHGRFDGVHHKFVVHDWRSSCPPSSPPPERSPRWSPSWGSFLCWWPASA